MEVEQEIQREYNPAHPNFKRWQEARNISENRAEFVREILSTEINLNALKILDIGSGEGSTSEILSKNNFVISVEVKPERIKKIQRSLSLQPILSDGLILPFKSDSFDLVILQDVIEHIAITKNFFEYLAGYLKENGIIYLSTPNRSSLINIISDPHWGLPLLSLLNRNQIKKYFLRFFRKQDLCRNDIAELLSLKKILSMAEKNFSVKICAQYSVSYLLNGGKGLVWSDFHKFLVKLASLPVIKNMLLNIVNDKPGMLNKFFTPTFYVILKKK